MDYQSLFLSPDGRIARVKFWLGMLFVTLANAGAISAVVLVLGVSRLTVMLAAFIAIVFAYPTYALMAKRFQDRDKPGWYAFFPLAAIYGTNMLDSAGVTHSEPRNSLYFLLSLLAFAMSVWILIELGLLKGTSGPNRFGPDPLGMARADAGL